MLRTILSRLGAFRDDTRGNLTVEAVILLPLLLWSFGATFVFFDAFRQNSVNEKAAYTIGDMLSRETSYITPDYMDSSRNLLKVLSRKSDSDLALRVSVIRWDANEGNPELPSGYKLMWSQARGAVTALADSDVTNWTDRLPVMVDGEQVILVETWSTYSAIADVGLGEHTFKSFVFTRPRFAPQLVWSNA